MKQFALLALFQCVWLACVLGGANQLPWLGPVILVVFIVVLFKTLSLPASALWRITVLGMIGSSVDGLLSLGGVFQFPGAISNWSPPYLVALWIGFVANFEGPLSWLRGRYGLAFLLGALAGPLNYIAGMKFGAVTFGYSMTTTGLVLAIEWALLLPALLFLHSRLSPEKTMHHASRVALMSSISRLR